MLKIVVAAVLATIIVSDNTIASMLFGVREANGPQRSLKGDRLPIEPTCSQAASSYREGECERSRTQPTERPQQLRIAASADSLPGQFAGRRDGRGQGHA